MRIFEKILVVICVFALLTVGCVFAVMANEDTSTEDVPTEDVVIKEPGTIPELEQLIANAKALTEADERYAAMVIVADYINNRELNQDEWGYDTAISDANKLAVESANKFFELIEKDKELEDDDENKLTADQAYDYVIKAGKLLRFFELPDDVTGYKDAKIAYDAAVIDMLNLFIKDIDANIGKDVVTDTDTETDTDAEEKKPYNTAANRIAINKFKRLLDNCQLYGETEALDKLKDQFEELVRVHEEAVRKNLDAINSQNSISDYDLPVYYEQNFDDCEEGWFSDDKKIANVWQIVHNGALNKIGITTAADGNKFYAHEYVAEGTAAGSYIQTSLKGFSAKNGLVIEFDIGAIGDIPKSGITIETGSFSAQTGSIPKGEHPPAFLVIDGDGNIYTNVKELNSQGQEETVKKVLLEGALVPDQWIHIMLVLNPDEFVYELFVEGEYIASYDAKHNGTTYDYDNLALRLSGGKSTQGGIAYDNFVIYSGSRYREHGALDNMTDDEKFVYYVDYFSNAKNNATDRVDAYKAASALIDMYWADMDDDSQKEYTDAVGENEVLKAAVDTYVDFDLEETLTLVKEENLYSYIAYVNELKSILRGTDTIDKRLELIDKINEFVAKNINHIDFSLDSDNKEGPDYDQYKAIFETLIHEVECDGNVTAFITHMVRFENVGTLSAKERYYNRAKELVIKDGIDIKLIEEIKSNEEHEYKEMFKDLVAAYDVYVTAHYKLDELIRGNNSNRIVRCIEQISDFDTEEEWLANSEEILRYLNIVKPYILEKGTNGALLYDESYDGIKGAIEYFNRTYDFFYKIQQEQHIEFIESALEFIMSTEIYIEKIGKVAVIDKYLASNEINYNDQRITALLSNFETCKEELELREEDYGAFLKMNSEYFNNLVEKMRTAETYKEQKELYDQASLYYFNIDASVEGTLNAIDIYEIFSEKLQIVEDACSFFLEAVALYEAAQTEDERYAALVDCYYNAQFVDMSYEGVPEAMDTYLAAYDAYMNYATSVNEDLAITGNAVGSARTNCGITVIIAIIIKKIFGV